ncbi:putative aldouronate transport system permease protein [Eubacterium ruminantium]|uniref:Putative aldouronate transport system permease protein n=1 Tax=Eubacterium ruminantium TaxID=42322 RepID=A0A1T4K3B3_9FIRM|nr:MULTISPECIES: carbohydrate ABC transporter permease [Eubacterium]MCR5367183.1 carbohydrate ABC transporter permease [Eubacterium sp.]SCW27937.1 putative aldouronate transport system permease protein [Eubacterium ruminantium]SDM13173.1 carbohydrate ABC transporter membrane protein 2, CUT1 family [Eubacterium ruminantium]SJZ36950.1 putative aldouronate transport system permease protein [Eubacterium ruminantium]
MDEKVVYKRKKMKTSSADKAFTVINTIIMTLFLIITLYPILNTLAVSFNDGIDSARGGIHFWPRIFSISNYKAVLRRPGIYQGALITVARTVFGTLSSLAVNALLAYIVSRKRFLFRNQLSLFWVVTMYVNGGMIPTLVLFKNLKLTGTFWVYVIPGMVSAFNMLVMRTYMNGLPDALEEAAQIDGAGYMKVFVRIISPLCKPVYATIALFIAVYHWNAWFDTMLYNRNKTKNTTLQWELMKLLTSAMSQTGGSANPGSTKSDAITPIAIRAAATILTALPILCLYPFLQRYFVSGVTIGGVKE